MGNKQQDWRENNLNDDEIHLLESVENGEWQSIGNIEERRNNLRSFFSKSNGSSNSVQIEIDKDIYNVLINKSKQYGMTYKELIEKMVLNFKTGKAAL